MATQSVRYGGFNIGSPTSIEWFISYDDVTNEVLSLDCVNQSQFPGRGEVQNPRNDNWIGRNFPPGNTSLNLQRAYNVRAVFDEEFPDSPPYIEVQRQNGTWIRVGVRFTWPG